MDATNVLMMALQGLVGAFCVVLYGMYNNMRNKADKTADELGDFKLLVAERYASKADMRSAVDSITQAFDRHANRVDVRMDRLEERIIEMKDKKD